MTPQMTKIDQGSNQIDDRATEGQDSTDPTYLAWKRRKIEAAVRDADQHLAESLTEKEVWQKHGLDH